MLSFASLRSLGCSRLTRVFRTSAVTNRAFKIDDELAHEIQRADRERQQFGVKYVKQHLRDDATEGATREPTPAPPPPSTPSRQKAWRTPIEPEAAEIPHVERQTPFATAAPSTAASENRSTFWRWVAIAFIASILYMRYKRPQVEVTILKGHDVKAEAIITAFVDEFLTEGARLSDEKAAALARLLSVRDHWQLLASVTALRGLLAAEGGRGRHMFRMLLAERYEDLLEFTTDLLREKEHTNNVIAHFFLLESCVAMAGELDEDARVAALRSAQTLLDECASLAPLWHWKRAVIAEGYDAKEFVASLSAFTEDVKHNTLAHMELSARKAAEERKTPAPSVKARADFDSEMRLAYVFACTILGWVTRSICDWR
jgi:hypothetical protein